MTHVNERHHESSSKALNKCVCQISLKHQKKLVR